MDEAAQQDQAPGQQTGQGPSHRHMRDHHRHQRPRPAGEQRPPAEPADRIDADDDEEEEKRPEFSSSRHSRGGRGHRGGRPPKKVYEEFINDPYCE